MLTTPCTRANLTRAIEGGAPHLRPLFLAVRDHGCLFGIAPQGDEPIHPPPFARPAILLVGDDTDRALGPDGFNRVDLAAFVARCSTAAIVSSAAVEETYAAAATAAVVLRQHVVIVETRLEWEQAWIDFVRAARPDIAMLVSTVAPMGHA